MNRLLGIFMLVPVLAFAFSARADSLTRDSLDAVLRQPYNTQAHIDRLNALLISLKEKSGTSEDLLSEQRQVLELARKEKYRQGEADALANLVRFHLEIYESPISLEYALEAVKIYEELGDSEKAANNLMQIGVIYYTSQNFTKSQEFYNQAIEGYVALGMPEKLSTLHYLSGLNYSKIQEHDKALEQFRQALSFMRAPDDHKGMAECQTGMAELFIRKSEPDSALYFAGRVAGLIGSLDSISREYGAVKVQVLRSAAWRQKGSADSALYYGRLALAGAESSSYRELRLDAYRHMSDAHVLNNDYKSAYILSGRYHQLRDSLFNEKNTMRISQLESAYALQKNEKQIALLEKEKKIRDILLRGIAAIAVLVLALSFLLFSRYQIKQKANQNLKEAYDKLKDTQEQLLHHRKMASLGRLATGISHEIQNPLNFVNNFAEITQDLLKEMEETGLNEEQAALVKELRAGNQKISTHGTRAHKIVRRLQDHSNMTTNLMEPADINAIIRHGLERAMKEMHREHPDFSCKVVKHLDESIPSMRVQASQLMRVVYNIMRNAFQSIAEKTGHHEGVYIPEVSVQSEAEAGHVTIRCRDNGTGMDAESREKAFEPFFTTKPTGSATGLGLSISYDIVNAHRGEIMIESEFGKYTEVTIRLPLGQS